MAEKKIKLEDISHISVKKLASKIKAVDRQTINLKGQAAVTARKPQYALFLGAGASVESGIITAGQMMKIFKGEIFGNDCAELETDGEKADWLKKQKWYKGGKNEYGCLFEQFADTKTERQRFIEIICDKNPLTKRDVEPSFGYVVLADLLLRNYINTVVTTNFDDLVYIAATTFTGIRPIVYAYGILASEMKMTAPHSKVLKLHGDYLYSNIVNTSDEMLVQSNAVAGKTADSREIISNLNMERQVRTVLDNFGLIVVGYSGGDETVMKLLEQVSEHNGFYWCYRKDSPPDEDVLKLVKSKNGKLVEIGGFDDLMKEISDRTDFSIEDLLESFERRKENLVKRITEFNESYKKKPLDKYAVELIEKQKDKPSDNLSAVDYLILGNKASDEKNYTLAEQHYRKAIELNPNLAEAYYNLGVLLRKEKRFDEAENHYFKAIELNPNYSEAYNNLGVLLFTRNEIDNAIENFIVATKIDKNYLLPRIGLANAYKKLGEFTDSKKWLNESLTLIKDDDYYNLACIYAIDENKDQSLKYLKLAVNKSPYHKNSAKTDPEFDWIRDDERFWEIVGKDDE